MALKILIKTAHDAHTKLRLHFYDTPPGFFIIVSKYTNILNFYYTTVDDWH